MKTGLHREASPREVQQLPELWRLRMVHTDLHYVNEFIRRRCAADLLALGVFKGSAKEITEAAALREAAIRYLDCDPLDPNVLAVCPGDGSTPRLGALLAFTTAWSVVSIDPALSWTDQGTAPPERPAPAWATQVRNLEVYGSTVEQMYHCVKARHGDRIVVLACHSHAQLPAALAAVVAPPETIGVAAMGCCVPQELPGRSFDREYIDDGVASPQRVVRVWRPTRGSDAP